MFSMEWGWSNCLTTMLSLMIMKHTQWLTFWGRDEMAVISQTTVSNAIFFNKNVWISLKISLKFFPRSELKICQHWCKWWLGADQATSHYLDQWWLIFPTHICVTWPQWVKSRHIWVVVRLYQYVTHLWINAFLLYLRFMQAYPCLVSLLSNIPWNSFMMCKHLSY